jgi:hypothetical protein
MRDGGTDASGMRFYARMGFCTRRRATEMGLWVAEITRRWGCGWLWDSNPKRNQVLARAVVAEITRGEGERLFVEAHKYDAVPAFLFFFFLIFEGHFRHFHTQNDVIPKFPSILTV